MKKTLLWGAIASLFFVSCSKNEMVESIESSYDFVAQLADVSRTELDGTSVIWNAEDELTIFTKTEHNRHYKVKTLTEDGRTATFGFVDYTGTSNGTISANYAVYPYNAQATLSGDVISTSIASEQHYNAEKVDLSYALMAAKSESNSFAFVNAGALMRFNVSKSELIPDSYTLNSIKLSSAANNIAGDVTIDLSAESRAVVASTGTKQITLTAINQEITTEAKAFYVALPAVRFADKDLTVTFTFADGKKSFALPAFDLLQGSIKTIAYQINDADDFTGTTPDSGEDFEGETPGTEAKPANNEIWYTATEKVVKDNWTVDTFGANITDHTFDQATGKGVITFDGNVTKIGDDAFIRSKLIGMIIPDSVTEIGRYAFYSCEGLTSITIPDSVTSIEDGTFQGCDGLTSITIPDSVTKIRNYAFSDTSLESVLIPENVISIGEYAFDSCDKLQSISLPDGLKSIGKYAFGSCCNLSDIVLPGEMTVIADGMFSGCSSLTNINLPENITTIGTYSFYGTSVTNITIPNKVVSIGNYAFNGCNLVNLTIPASVTSIGHNAFEGSSGELIVNCNIPSGQSNSTRPFYNTNFTKITIGDAVTSIGRLAFYGCNSLTSLTIGKNVTKIGEKAFFGTNITRLDIPDSVTSMGENAFERCTLLKELTIGSGLTKIPTYAFESCGFTDVIIPDNVNTIGQYAFYNCAELTSVAISDSVTTIEEGVFNNCSSLTSITIPDSVTEIGERAFWSCSGLTSITIPNSVTSIGYNAFQYCSNLTSVFCECTTPPTVASYLEAFDDNAADRKIYVPRESVDAYKSADGWKNYADSIEPYDF